MLLRSFKHQVRLRSKDRHLAFQTFAEIPTTTPLAPGIGNIYQPQAQTAEIFVGAAPKWRESQEAMLDSTSINFTMPKLHSFIPKDSERLLELAH